MSTFNDSIVPFKSCKRKSSVPQKRMYPFTRPTLQYPNADNPEPKVQGANVFDRSLRSSPPWQKLQVGEDNRMIFATDTEWLDTSSLGYPYNSSPVTTDGGSGSPGSTDGSDLTDIIDRGSYHKLLIDEMLEKILKDAEEKSTAESKVAWGLNVAKIGREIVATRRSAIDHTRKEGQAKTNAVTKARKVHSPMATVAINDKHGNTSFQEVKIITIAPVKRLPPFTDWTRTTYNVKGEDTKELTHYPNIDGLTSKQQAKFEEQLHATYFGQYHGDIPIGSRVIKDQSFFNLVNSMARDLRFGFLGSNSPSDCEELWISLSKVIDGGGTAMELKNRYETIQRKENPAKAGLNLDDSGVADSESEGQSKDTTMNSFAAIFCRRCFIYDCQRHSEVDHLDSKAYRDRSARSGMKKDIRINCEQGRKCWTIQNVRRVRKKEVVLAEWTDLKEVSVARCHWDTFGQEHCLISYLLMTKSCMQVFELAVHLKLNSEGDQGYGGSPSSDLFLTPVKPEQLLAAVTKDIYESTTGTYYAARYVPCNHPNDLACDEKNPNCYCGKMSSTCEKYCFCSVDCPKRFRGCKCENGHCGPGTACLCFAANRECDPDFCIPCEANKHEPGRRGCGNVSMQRRYQPNDLKVDKSGVHKGGLGLFSLKDISKRKFIMEYCGEMITHDEAERRGVVYDAQKHTFLFALDDHYVLDSTRIGNDARFINSSKRPNAIPKIMRVNGDYRIGIFAHRDITAGEEVVFDYHHLITKKSGTKSKGTSPSTTK